MSSSNTGTGCCQMIGPASYSLSTKCTVQPVTLHARVEHGLVHVMAVHAGAAERRDQRRVNVHHAADKIVRHRGELQEPGHRHVVDARLAAGGEDGVAVGMSPAAPCGKSLRGESPASESRPPRQTSSPPAFAVLDTTSRISTGSSPSAARSMKILQRPAGAGNQHGELECMGMTSQASESMRDCRNQPDLIRLSSCNRSDRRAFPEWSVRSVIVACRNNCAIRPLTGPATANFRSRRRADTYGIKLDGSRVSRSSSLQRTPISTNARYF